MENTHEKYMKVALLEAKKAYAEDEVPIGAIIVVGGKIIAKAHNKREKTHDATAHAEILAIKKACKKLEDFRLQDAVMYVTLEPCTMCMGAILNARVGTLVFGGSQNKENILTAREINERAELNHKCEIISGVMASECSLLVSEYFQSKRKVGSKKV